MLRRNILVLFLLGFLNFNIAIAASVEPELPKLDVKSYLLIDYHSGVVLASKKPDKKIEPASITKLMTAYVLYRELGKGKISVDDKVLISEKAWRMEGSRMFVEAGKRVPFKRLLKGLIIQSGNDAAVALAEHTYGSEEIFATKMNEQARMLGMTNTHFINVTGWPGKDHYTTARDIAVLTKSLIRDFPNFYDLYKEKEFSYNGIKQYNRNKLLWLDPTVDGVKTGFTKSAGYCLVSSAKREKMRLISVVLGAKSIKERADISQQILEFGYRFYETHRLYKAGSVLAEPRVWKGNRKTIPVGLMEDFYITIPKGDYQKLKGTMNVDTGVDAPIQRGQILGKITVKNTDKVVSELDLKALDSISAGGVWRKVSDGVQKIFH